MQVEQRVRAFARGGRLTKWKGRVASIAPSLFLCSASVLAVSAGASFGEVVNGTRTTPLVSSIDEDHTITATGSIDINRLPGPALVQVNVPDYSSTLTNAGQLTAPEANVRTRAAVEINGDLSGTVLNSGTISMGAALGDTAVIFGIDVSGVTTGSVQNTGVIDIANSALTIGTSVGILANQVDGTLSNSGTITLRGDNVSRAEAIGIAVDIVNGTASNSGSIGIDVSSSGGQAIADGISLTTINGMVDNSGPINVSATGATIAGADGFGIGDLVGILNNVGAINVSATAGNNANGDAIEITNLSGRLTNAGPLTVAMTAGNTGGAFLDVVQVSNLTGSLTNTGFLVGRARGGSVIADGFDIGGVAAGASFDNSGIVIVQARATTSTASADGLEFGDVLGSVSNSGPVNAIAEGVTSATARGIRAGNLTGTLLNSANILADAVASNGSAKAFGIQVDEVRNQLTNDGELVALANGSRNGAAIGISTDFVQGTLANNGAITAIGLGSSANATGIETGNVDGSLINANTITLEAVATSSSALVTGIDSGRLNGTLQNSGNISVLADAVSHASAYGIDVGEIGGTLSNSGSITIQVDNGSSIEAIGIRSSTVQGTFSNTGNITVASQGSSGSAEGLRASSIAANGTMTNTGTITATARGQGSGASVEGIRVLGRVAGSLENSGQITIQATDSDSANSIGILTGAVDGSLANSGTITATAGGGPFAFIEGINVRGNVDGSLDNSAAITVQAVGTSSAYVDGINTTDIGGTFSNSGVISAFAQADFAGADGIALDDVLGSAVNSGDITARASGDTTARASGIALGFVDGSFSNSGSIVASATITNSSAPVPFERAVATGINVDNINEDPMGGFGVFENSGAIAASASGLNASALGLRFSHVGGKLTNSGNITVNAVADQGSTAFAAGILGANVRDSGDVLNSGTLQVSATGQNVSAVAAVGMSFDQIDTNVSNAGAISVSAQGDMLVRAHGITTDALPTGGVLSHSGSISVSANGGTDTEAYGIFVGNANGTVNVTGDINVQSSGKGNAIFLGQGGDDFNATNSGNISVAVNTSVGSSALGAGIVTGNISNNNRISNSGSIQVFADGRNVATVEAIGLEVGDVDGRVDNSGAISVSAKGDQIVRARGLTLGALSANSTLNSTGPISASANGGKDTEVFGIFVGSAQGTVNVTGDVSAVSTGKSYAIYLGDGGGTLNAKSTANITGTIRVSDHDVNLSHVGGRVVYRFQDEDIANGVFTTSVSSASQGWFTSGEGGAAPVYASFDAKELQPNTNQPFEIAGLSYALARQLDSADAGNVDRDRVVLSTRGSGPIEGFRPYFLVSGSRSDGTASGSSASLTSNMWSVSVGATRDLGTGLRYGFGASYLENDGTFGSSSFDTSGVFISGIVAQNFGFADLSFGLGYGDLDNSESRFSGSTMSEAEYSSNIMTALVAAEREIALRNGSILTPRASFLYGEQKLDGYTETGQTVNASVGDRTVTFNETRIGGAYATPMLGGRLSASLEVVHRDADAPSVVDVTIFGNTLSLASGGGGTDTFGEVRLNYEKPFDHGGVVRLEARSTLGADVSTQALWASYEWKF